MERYGKIFDGAIVYAPTRNGALITDDGIVFAPSESTYNANGYYKVMNVEQDGTDEVIDGNLLHYLGAPVTTEYTTTYEELTVQYIRERFTADDELAIHRHYITDPTTYADEWSEYNEYVEACKARAKEETA